MTTLQAESPVLRARSLEKRYRHGHEVLEVLRGLDLEVPRGMLLAIVGASGSGKSTLLNILGTLDRADAGSVELEGENLSSLGSRQLAQVRARRIGFVFQFHYLLPEFSAEENVMMPLLVMGQSPTRARERAHELLEAMSLTGWRDHRPAELSGGEAQRVAVARALASSPDVVLADEPSGNLDSKSAQELHELLTTLCRTRHQTFVIATHNERLASAADRVLRLEGGRLRPVS